MRNSVIPGGRTMSGQRACFTPPPRLNIITANNNFRLQILRKQLQQQQQQQQQQQPNNSYTSLLHSSPPEASPTFTSLSTMTFSTSSENQKTQQQQQLKTKYREHYEQQTHHQQPPAPSTPAPAPAQTQTQTKTKTPLQTQTQTQTYDSLNLTKRRSFSLKINTKKKIEHRKSEDLEYINEDTLFTQIESSMNPPKTQHYSNYVNKRNSMPVNFDLLLQQQLEEQFALNEDEQVKCELKNETQDGSYKTPRIVFGNKYVVQKEDASVFLLHDDLSFLLENGNNHNNNCNHNHNNNSNNNSNSILNSNSNSNNNNNSNDNNNNNSSSKISDSNNNNDHLNKSLKINDITGSRWFTVTNSNCKNKRKLVDWNGDAVSFCVHNHKSFSFLNEHYVKDQNNKRIAVIKKKQVLKKDCQSKLNLVVFLESPIRKPILYITGSFSEKTFDLRCIENNEIVAKSFKGIPQTTKHGHAVDCNTNEMYGVKINVGWDAGFILSLILSVDYMYRKKKGVCCNTCVVNVDKNITDNDNKTSPSLEYDHNDRVNVAN